MSLTKEVSPFSFPRKQGLCDPAAEREACGIGFVASIEGRQSHEIVDQGLEVLRNLEHRGACGCEENTGDGAGLLIQTPHAFLARECDRLGIRLGERGSYGVAMVFLPQIQSEREDCQARFERTVREEGQRLLGWRDVPVDDSPIGPTARAGQPAVRQLFIGRGEGVASEGAFERKLFVIRRRVVNEVRASGLSQQQMFYVVSLSCKTLVYKGMLISSQLPVFYPDVTAPDFESGLCLVHSRFSTNTFPNWARAHPYRYIGHNGEINTLRGNVNWMRTRERLFRSTLFGDDLKKILPVIDPDGSDSAMFDNCLEMLVLGGRSLAHAVMMMIPEPWERHESMTPERRAFYEFHASLMEAWDGPASIAFTDGVQIGAVLDRNGLRPSRYYVTKDGLVVMASEVGVLDIAPERILEKGRLQPGRMLLVDTKQGRIISDDELKQKIATEQPYAKWLQHNSVHWEDLPSPRSVIPPDHETVLQRQQVYGYTQEDVRMILSPMARDGVEGVGSMGTDTPLAVLSEKPQLLYNYFKQLFAQVTNPPVDAIREELIMSVGITIGPEQNLLEPSPKSAWQIELESPILDNEQLETLRGLDGKAPSRGFRAVTLPILYKAKEGGDGLRRAMAELCRQALSAARSQHPILILSHRGIDAENAPIPALLAVAGLHHFLIREGARTKVGLVLESGEPREVHHFALLISYGAAAVNPYLAFETLHDQIREGQFPGLTPAQAEKRYIKAATKGVLKVMSKMGISTIQSYCGAQIFEALGLSRELVDEYFTGTPTRIGGIGLDEIAEESRRRHERAFPDRPLGTRSLDPGGQYQWRHDGELHLFNPLTVHTLQLACRTDSYDVFKRYSALIDDQSRNLYTLRGLMELHPAGPPVPIEEVEPVEELMRRFKSGAMSYGSISKEAHEALAIAMNRIGGKSNTGEGGEDPARYVPDPNGDSRNSAIKQVASGRFGVTSQYLVNARELQIKIAQGAKPGEGGQLPGAKVYPWIARVRYSTPGVGLISPPPHHDIYSIEDLAQLIHDLKNANHHARISVKLVAAEGVGTIAAGVAKAKADVILISGHDGGTGASPLSSIKHAGVPWELGLADAHQTLVMNNLRSRVALETDGQLKTGRDVVIGAMLGAEEFGFATAPLVALGCIMMRVCHLNTCPAGVATQDPKLREKFAGDPGHAVNFMRFVAREVREHMARLGFRKLTEMVGRTDCIRVRTPEGHPKAGSLDLSAILHRPEVADGVGRFCQTRQDHGLDKSLDRTRLLELCAPALENGTPVSASLPIRNVNRVVGTMVGSELTRRWGPAGLAEDTIQLHFEGSAGQSFGAFVPRGMTLTLEGDANDYLGKGLSGGRIVVYPPKGSSFVAEENVIVGNVAFYGATSGEAYIRGLAGERFCVRNSGVEAVIEGVGDHGCEYMTGGRVVVLGRTGRNFAAGMSGGIAYVLDREGTFERRCNLEMSKLLPLEDPDEIEAVKSMIFRHARFTDSRLASQVLVDFAELVPRFVRVVPDDYGRVLQAQRRMRDAGMSDEEAAMAAFEVNARDESRIGGR